MDTKKVSPVELYLSQLNPSSQRVQKQALNLCASIISDDHLNYDNFDWSTLEYKHVAIVRAAIFQKYKPNTSNRILTGLKNVMKHCWLLGYCTNEEYAKTNSIKSIIGTSLPAGRMLDKQEIKKLFDACRNDESKNGIRDLAILAVMYSCGLRRQEVSNLKLSDYDKDDKTIIINGKRNKQAIGYLIDTTPEYLEQWLDVRGREDGYLFNRIDQWGHISKNQISTCGIYYLLDIRQKEAGVEHFSPHDLRRTYISDLLELNIDVFMVSRLARHENPTMTAKYDRRKESTKREAVMRLSLPV